MEVNETLRDALGCPVYGEFSMYYISQFQFWIEGILQTIVAVPGLAGNILFGLVLTRKELRNPFNLLLVALSFFDSCYIIGAVLESLRTSFDCATDLHLILFPYVLYPGQQTAMTLSIFLIVAIAFERYVAVHNPLDYQQAMTYGNAIRNRLLKYLLPAIILSIIFNVPRFFESTYNYVDMEIDGANVTKVQLSVTPLRVNPTYATVFNWSQSIVLGFLPAVSLIYFNTRIYIDIRDRERRRRPHRNMLSKMDNNKSTTVVNNTGDVRRSTNVEVSTPATPGDGSRNGGATAMPAAADEAGNGKTDRLQVPGKNNSTLSVSSDQTPQRHHIKRPSIGRKSTTPSSQNAQGQSTSKRRKAEDKMAMIFVAIVTGFLVTNFPRILLNFHEVIVFDTVMACRDAHLEPFPVWALILGTFSHFLMVINSSMNILFYCIFNAQFRTEVSKVMQECGAFAWLRPQSNQMKAKTGSLNADQTRRLLPRQRNDQDEDNNENDNDEVVSTASGGKRQNWLGKFKEDVSETPV